MAKLNNDQLSFLILKMYTEMTKMEYKIGLLEKDYYELKNEL